MIKQGIDIVEINRIERLYNKYGDIFLNKVFTKDERKAFAKKNQNIAFLAKRFAVKEAFAKALGIGFKDGIRLLDIQTLNDSKGCPIVSYSSKIEQILQKEFEKFSVSVSLSDERQYAIASVIILKL